MAERTWKIVDGPSREDLFDALRLRHEKRQVTLTIAIGPEKTMLSNFLSTVSRSKMVRAKVGI